MVAACCSGSSGLELISGNSRHGVRHRSVIPCGSACALGVMHLGDFFFFYNLPFEEIRMSSRYVGIVCNVKSSRER